MFIPSGLVFGSLELLQGAPGMSRAQKATALNPSLQPWAGRDKWPRTKFRRGALLSSPKIWFPGAVVCLLLPPLLSCVRWLYRKHGVTQGELTSSELCKLIPPLYSCVQVKLTCLFALPPFPTKAMPSAEVLILELCTQLGLLCTGNSWVEVGEFK